MARRKEMTGGVVCVVVMLLTLSRGEATRANDASVRPADRGAAAVSTAIPSEVRPEHTDRPAGSAASHVMDRSRTLRPEVPDDPPAAQDILRQRAIGRPGIWTRGPYTSVQVNVDGFGNNIIGDAANEPSIAIDPTDPSKIVIGWRQFDTIESNFRQSGYGYSQDGGQTWTFPGVLEPNVFSSDPVLGSDLAGNIYYYALQPDRGPGAWACYMYKSGDGGLTWPQEVYARGGDKAWMTIDNTLGIGSGNIYLSWSPWTSCCAPGYFTRSVDGGLSFMTPMQIPGGPFFGTLTVDPQGTLYVAGGSSVPGGEFLVAKSTNAQNPAQTPVFDAFVHVDLGGWFPWGDSPNPGGLVGQPWIASDHSGGPTDGNLYLLSSVFPFSGLNPMDVMFSRSTDGGLTWSTPKRINDDPTGNYAWQWFGTMSVAPNGRIDVVWNDTRNTGLTNLSELYYAFSEDAGVTWSANFPVSPVFNSWVGWPQQNKLGDYYHMVSDNNGANLAYAATLNGEQDVYFLRLVRDCTDNGLDDDCDIDCGPPGGRCDVPGCGTRSDCNDNHIPDECEADLDCNSNGTQDVCDIAAGRSDDCNFNDVPDECELTGNDCNSNTVPDECDPDCNYSDSPDDCDIRDGTSEDCNGNGTPDECDLPDCNHNDTPDECDIAAGTSDDCQPDEVPDECQLMDIVIPPVLGPCSPAANFGASWCDDLETYPRGSIQGLNNWQGWGPGSGDPTAAGTVTTERNHTTGGTKSLKIVDDDTVRLFDGYNLAASPVWVLRNWIYIPSSMSGMAYFIVLADYDGGGSGTTWAVEVDMDPYWAEIYDYYGGGWLPLILDAWVEIRLEINFAQDWVQIFYDDVPLTEYPWSAGGGSMNLAAIDLYGPGDGYYHDDLSLFVPLTTDCNATDVPDECDIAGGPRRDCNDNGIPDECDIDFDISDDVEPPFGIPDECAPCPPGSVTFVDPPDGVVDARQPHPPGNPGNRQGIDTIEVEGPAGMDEPSCWWLCETSEDGAKNTIAGVDDNGDGTFTVNLQRAISTGAVTAVVYAADDDVTHWGEFTSHPAHVDSDTPTSNDDDILVLIDVLAGNMVSPWGVYSEDADQSGLTAPADILRVIDLLNGAPQFDQWLGTTLPNCDSCCMP